MTTRKARAASWALGVVLVVLVIGLSKDSGLLLATKLDPAVARSATMTQGAHNNISSIVCCDEVKSSTHVDHYIFEKDQEPFQQNTSLEQRQLPSKNLFVVNPWVNESIVEHNAKFIPHDMKIHVFNDTSMTQSAKLIDQELKRLANVTGAWEAYQLLRPWAYRADLWRYMVLWSEGGIYLDGKMMLHAPVEPWAALAPEETISLCLDDVDSWNPTARQGQPTSIFFQAVLSARRQCPILLEAIKMTIDNVNRRVYPSISDGILPRQKWLACLAVTGPVVIGLAAAKFPNDTYRQDLKFKAKKGITLIGKQQSVISRDAGEHKKVHSSGGVFYWDLFKSHAIYCDSPASKNHSDCNIQALLQSSPQG